MTSHSTQVCKKHNISKTPKAALVATTNNRVELHTKLYICVFILRNEDVRQRWRLRLVLNVKLVWEYSQRVSCRVREACWYVDVYIGAVAVIDLYPG